MFFVTVFSSHTLHFEAMYTNRALAFVTIIKKPIRRRRRRRRRRKMVAA
jgi:hypothetical protein